MDRDELLTKSYEQLQWVILHGGRYEINDTIQNKVNYLEELFGLCREDILHDIYEAYISRRHYNQYDPAEGALSTFMAHYANLSLLNMIRKHERLNRNYREVPLPHESRDRYEDRQRYEVPYNDNRNFNNGLANRNTPEDDFIARELFLMMDDYFGSGGVIVLLGERGRREEAGNQNIPYETYRKRLYRRRKRFQAILREFDYL